MADIRTTHFGVLTDGRAVSAYTLTNRYGSEVVMLDWGASLHSVRVPDGRGRLGEVILGCDSLADYQCQQVYLGASVGRFANRIAEGRFVLDGRRYQLECNQAPNHLHGGRDGFDRRLWRASILEPGGDARLRLTLQSADGDQGYPGNLAVTLTVSLSDESVLTLAYEAEADQATPVNLTHHAYFNLDDSDSCLEHRLQLLAERYLPLDAAQIPQRWPQPVAGTPFDFRQPKALEQDLAVADEQLRRAGGYDHYFLLEPGPEWPIRVQSPCSGRCLEVSTSLPGVHLYSGNFLQGTLGRRQRYYANHAGFCLETQYPADSPNREDGQACIVRPGQPYRAVTRFRFSVCAEHAL